MFVGPNSLSVGPVKGGVWVHHRRVAVPRGQQTSGARSSRAALSGIASSRPQVLSRSPQPALFPHRLPPSRCHELERSSEDVRRRCCCRRRRIGCRRLRDSSLPEARRRPHQPGEPMRKVEKWGNCWLVGAHC